MSNRKSKKAVAVVTSLSMLANASPQINAIDQIAIPQRIQNAFPPTFTNPLQPTKDFSINSIEEKINNVLNPVEKKESNQAKLLVDDSSGDCGYGVSYTFTASTGELKISGTGAMTDYNYDTMPWSSYRSSITSLVIENGVTSIGSYAFDGCSGLTSITIPSSVNSIGSKAFYGCSGLTSVSLGNNYCVSNFKTVFPTYSNITSITIGNSVTSIGGWAFYGCSGLTSVTIGNGVTSIGSSAFQYCSGLTGQLTIPASVTEIGDYAFGNCSGLTSINVDENNT